jgi:hypothetical protein
MFLIYNLTGGVVLSTALITGEIHQTKRSPALPGFNMYESIDSCLYAYLRITIFFPSTM